MRAFSRHLARPSRRGDRANFSTLILADSDAKNGLAPATYHVVSAAEKLGQEMSFVCTTKEAADKASKMGKTYLADGVKTADVLTKVIVELQKKDSYTHILGSTSDVSKDTLPRVGALLDVQPLSDVLSVYGKSTFGRPMYAGNAIAKVENTDPLTICTIRTTAFDACAEGSGSNEITNIAPQKNGNMKFVEESVKLDDKPQLGSADVVVAGGRALGSDEAFDTVLQPLCDKMKAAMGASRAAVDAGYVPNELQVGQTGKVVAPNCYVAVGISGAIQHLAGMKDSKVIVAINKDPDAPIFQVSDYGLVGDLFEKVPEMTEKI